MYANYNFAGTSLVLTESTHNLGAYGWNNMASSARVITPCRACAARGQVIALGLDIYRFCPKKYSLSEVHFNTGRLLFEFNGLQYHFAAGQASQPSQILLVCRSRDTNIAQLQTTPPTSLDIPLNTPTLLLQYCTAAQHSLQL